MLDAVVLSVELFRFYCSKKAVVEKAQLEPQIPWFFIEVNALTVLQSNWVIEVESLLVVKLLDPSWLFKTEGNVFL